MSNISVDDIDDAVAALGFIRRRLVFTGQIAFIVTLAHVIVVLATFGSFMYFAVGILTSMVLVAVAAGAALVFESVRRRGNALFEEISDEFQWHIADRYRALRAELPSSDAPRPPLRYRVELRSFSRASDLPLTPGALGPAVYVVTNIGLALVLVIRSYAIGFRAF